MQIERLNNKNKEKWKGFLEESLATTFKHTELMMEYYINSKIGTNYKNESFFVKNNKEEILATLNLFLYEDENGLCIGYENGVKLLNPLFKNGLKNKEKKQIMDLILKYIEIRYDGIKKIEWEIYNLNKSAEDYIVDFFVKNDKFYTKCYYTSVLNLEKTQEEIYKNFTKGHKAAINKAKKTIDIKIYDQWNITSEKIDQFMNFYFKIAEKKTRPEKSFEIIENMVRNNNGFLVEALKDNEIVGYTYIIYYRDSAYYFMSCKDNRFKNENIAHLMQWNAICELKVRGVKIYDIGIQDFNQNLDNIATIKDVSISKFKAGFGGELIQIFAAERYFEKKYMTEVFLNRVNLYIEKYFEN